MGELASSSRRGADGAPAASTGPGPRIRGLSNLHRSEEGTETPGDRLWVSLWTADLKSQA